MHLRPIPARSIDPALRLRGLCMALSLALPLPALADVVPQPLPFAQDWSSTALIATNDSWAGVPGIVGFLGDYTSASPTAVDARTVLGTLGSVDVIANQSNPSTLTAGGVAEFDGIANPTIALNGSGTADAPGIVIHLDTTGQQAIQVAYLLRDLDGSADDAIQPVALQYRVGGTGDFINVPAGYVADATTGGTATRTTAVNATLPAAADNQAEVQVRILTTNAAGNDEWVGVDDIAITGTPIGGGLNAPIAVTCPASVRVDAGVGGGFALSARDSDSVVTAITLGAGAPEGVAIGSFVPAGVDGDTATATLVVAPSVPAGSHPLQVNVANNELQTASCTVVLTVDALVTIPQIQGSGERSPLEGQVVSTRGVVTRLNNNGYFLQDPAGDGDAATADGIFVFTGTAPAAPVAVGAELRVRGTVTEFAVGSSAQALAHPVTELTSTSATFLSGGHSVAPLVITLPEAMEGELERYEGMLVRIASPLTVSQNFFLGRYGQVTLSAEGRLEKPTNRHPAGSPEALALAEDNVRRRILLDDGSTQQNPNPAPYIGADNTLRAGDTLPEGVTGIIDYGLATNNSAGPSDHRIHPTEPVHIQRSNPRPATPPAVGGNVRVASFNVLNYFSTIDQSGAACYPSGTRSDCRGADSALELERQRAKIVPAINGLGADVVGLIEIENNGNGATQDLVNRLNAATGAPTWAAVALPSTGAGTDAIRQAIIYKPARVSLVGAASADSDPVHNRPPIAQRFALANGERFSVVVNHFKSKNCDPAPSGGNVDQGDGQGCYNAARVAQAQALVQFIGQLQAAGPDVVVVGDLNAYGKEDPVLALTSAGLVDEIARFNPFARSYVFDGESGYIDHALTTPSLSAKVAGAALWAINADEPSFIDYNTEFKLGDPLCTSGSCSPDYYAPTVYRSSDHDPVLLGLSLVKAVNGTGARDTLVGTAGDDRITGGAGADTITTLAGADTVVYTSLRDALDTVTDFAPGADRVDLSALLASIGQPAASAIANGVVRLVDTASGAVLQIDTDGHGGAAAPRPLVTLLGVSATQIQPARDLGL